MDVLQTISSKITSLELSNQTKGTLYCVVGVFIVSPDSLVVRKIAHLPNDTVIFLRYFLLAEILFIAFSLAERDNAWKKSKEIGYIGLLAGIIWGVQNYLLTIAFQTTAAANALVILAANPIFSALFSLIILKESIPLRTIIASLVCLAAIIIIFSSELGKGNASIGGVLCALFSSIFMGLYLVLLRMASLKYG